VLLTELFFADKPRRAAALAELGLAPMQAGALQVLDPERPMPMSALAQGLLCDNSNVTGIVDRLEAAGLVQRRPDEHDRRVKTLVVTPKGAEVRAQVGEAMATPPPALAALPATDARVLRDLLRRALG